MNIKAAKILSWLQRELCELIWLSVGCEVEGKVSETFVTLP